MMELDRDLEIEELLEFHPEEENIRLDVYLSSQEELSLTRSRIQKLIDEGLVQVNDVPGKANYKLRKGDKITLMLPPPKELKVEPENILLDIIYEDEDIIVINKRQGMVVHPAHGNYSGTVVNALLAHCQDLSGIGGVMRPGIVHRLDKDTSGLLMIAKNDLAHLGLTEQIKNRAVQKKYLALVYGNLKEEKGTIDAPIGRHPIDRKKMAVVPRTGKPAVTHYQVLQRYGNHTYLEIDLETGRTHQIRVHLAYIGHPVVGDPVYSSKNRFNLPGQFLHAYQLTFKHPRTGRTLEFTAPLPEVMQKVLRSLE